MKKLLQQSSYACLLSLLVIQPIQTSQNQYSSLLTKTMHNNWTNAALIGMNTINYGLTYKHAVLKKPDGINLYSWLATASLLASYGKFSVSTKTNLKLISLSANLFAAYGHYYNLNSTFDEAPKQDGIDSHFVGALQLGTREKE